MSSANALSYTPDPALSFWPTPPDIADDLVYWLLQPWHCTGEGVRVLEPSAGDGHLVRAIRDHLPDAHIAAVEPSAARAATLRAQRGLADEVIESTLEDYLANVAMSAFAGVWQPFHLVVMNPPFTLAGRPEAWAEHVLATYNDPYLLAPGGVVGAVVPYVVKTGKSPKVRAVRDLLNPYYGIQECERGAFAAVGAKVSTALIWAQTPLGAEATADRGAAT
jgi:hypothetical protein